jgi:hypothetical protein
LLPYFFHADVFQGRFYSFRCRDKVGFIEEAPEAAQGPNSDVKTSFRIVIDFEGAAEEFNDQGRGVIAGTRREARFNLREYSLDFLLAGLKFC